MWIFIEKNDAEVLYRCSGCGEEKIFRKSSDASRSDSCRECYLRKAILNKENERFLHIWENLKGRCYNEKNPSYKIYGALGIKVCDEWKNDSKKFVNWCIEQNPAQGLTLVRIKEDLDYSPNNCYFSTRNKRLVFSAIDNRFLHMLDNMKQRCYNKNHPDFKNYGARGIIICDEWKNDTQTFIWWCIEQNPTPELTIERRHNNLGYSPENCFFATRTEQNRNKRNSVWVEYNGERMLSSEAARASGMDPVTLRNRIKNYPDRPEIWFQKESLSLGDRKSKAYKQKQQHKQENN